jgi:hypothetical protein
VYETEHVVWAIERANRSRIATCKQDEETEKKKKGGTKVSKPLHFTTVWLRPWNPILTKSNLFVGLTNVITYAKNGSSNFIGFSRPEDGKTHVLS